MSFNRHRNLRRTAHMRDLVRETKLSKDDLIYPIFVTEEEGVKREIESMKGVYQISLDLLHAELEEVVECGIKSVIFFGIPKHKDERGSGAYDDNGIVQEACKLSKKLHPELLVILDTCLCEYTDHGHCGLIDPVTKDVDNDSTLPLLVDTAVSQARAGADIIAPSNMMDGFVKEIREGLDENGFSHIPIMSYGIKYSSKFYGPFRDAAESSPSFGDRRTYQMDPANRLEALRELRTDIDEGADMMIVKPALSYLDIIRDVRNNTELPIIAYNVSGEYSMTRTAVDMGLLDEPVIFEQMISMKRAGADIIITYFAKDLCRMIDEGME